MKQLLIPIQSFSNIITNSSSEIFCIIKGDKETILFINNLLFNLLGKNVYDEDSPMYELLCKSDLDKDDYDEEQWEKLPEYSIQISLPYNLWRCHTFFEEGLNSFFTLDESLIEFFFFLCRKDGTFSKFCPSMGRP